MPRRRGGVVARVRSYIGGAIQALGASIGGRSGARHPGASSFKGAVHNRFTEDWILAGIRSADAEVKGDLRGLRKRAREKARNWWATRNFIGVLSDNLIGENGIQLESQPFGPDGEVDEALAQRIEDAWLRWGHRQVCTVDGRMSWHNVQELMVETEAGDGEAVLRILPGFDNDFGFALQALDPDQLDEEWNRPRGDNANEIRMGVEVNRWGRPVRYWMFDAHPFDFQAVHRRERKPIDARNLIHRYQIRRPGQTRGVSWFAPVLMSAQMLDGLQEGELIASRIAASKSGVFEVDPEAVADPELPSGVDDFTWDMEPGAFDMLPAGVKPHFFDPTHPNDAFGDFNKIILRSIAAGLRTSYASLSGDLTDVSFSSIRQGALNERDVYRRLQRHTWEHVHQRIFEGWIRWAVAMGMIDGVGPQNLHEATRHTWRPRGWSWVDPLKDLQAAELAIRLGIDSRTRVAASLGRSFGDVVRELAREEKLAKKHGVDLTITGGGGELPDPDTGLQDPDAIARLLESVGDDVLEAALAHLNGGRSRIAHLLGTGR